MRGVLILGVLLMLGGGAMMVFDEYETEKEHGATVLGQELSVSTTETEKIPMALSGTLLGVGAILTVVAAVRLRKS